MEAAKLADGRLDDADRALDNLRRIVHVLYSHACRMERLADLTPAQAWLIGMLSGMATARISDLTRTMRLSPSAIVRIVGRLEERGLVVRTRSSSNRGTIKVALAHMGKKLSGRMPPVPQELLLKGLSEIPPDRLRAISEVLESLVRILGAETMSPRLFFAPVANLPVDDTTG